MREFHWTWTSACRWSLLCNDVAKWQQRFRFLPGDFFRHDQTICHIPQSLQMQQQRSDRCVRLYELRI